MFSGDLIGGGSWMYRLCDDGGLMLVVMCVIDECWCWCIYLHRLQHTHAASASVSSFTPSAVSSVGTTVVVLGRASCVGVRLRQGASPLAVAVWPLGVVVAFLRWAVLRLGFGAWAALRLAVAIGCVPRVLALPRGCPCCLSILSRQV